MAVVCETCGTSNRDTAMFCIGCAGRLPAFVATGPSALEAMPPPPRTPRSPAAEEQPRGGIVALAETPAFWLTLGLAGLAAVALAVGAYLLDRREGVDIPIARNGPIAADRVAPGPETVSRASTAPRPAASASASAASVTPAADATPSPQEWLDKAEELVDSVVPRLGGTSSSAGSASTPLTPLVPAPLARDDIGPDAPARVVAAFYGALAAGDGATAAAIITPSKRDVGRFSGERMTRFYGSFNEPLSIRSIRQLDAHAVEARYTYRATSTVCEGVALVRTERVAERTVIRSIRANC